MRSHRAAREDAATRRPWLAAFAVLCLSAAAKSTAAQTIENADLLSLKAHYLKAIQQDRAAITHDDALLNRAHEAHEQAAAANDSDGESVTAQAAANAQAALDREQRALDDDEVRLQALNQALTIWHAAGDAVGPRALATIVKGEITVDTPQGPAPFDRFAPVHPGQHIHVGPNGYLELLLGDGSQMHIGPGSDFLYERDVQGATWQLFRGELHKITIIMGVRGANEPRYRGAVAIVAVRGTDFTLATDGKQDTFTVFDGAIEVDPGGGRPKVTLTGGQTLTVAKSGPAHAASFDPNAAAKWWRR